MLPEEQCAFALTAVKTSTVTGDSMEVWHKKLGHVNYQALRKLAMSGAIDGLKISHPQNTVRCLSCALSKSTYATRASEHTDRDAYSDMIFHVDLSGPVAASRRRNQYFIVSNWRGFIQVRGLRLKSDATQATKDFLRFIERQAGVKEQDIRIVRSDNGTEFLNKDFRRLVHHKGYLHQLTNAYSSHQNGVAERSIRTITEAACAMLIESRLPHDLWDYALAHAAFVRNRIPRSGEDITPYEKLFNRRPNVAGLAIFGQTVVVRIPEEVRDKSLRFLGRGQLGAFIGNSEEKKGSVIYLPAHERMIVESKNVQAMDSMYYDVDPEALAESNDQITEPETAYDSDYEPTKRLKGATAQKNDDPAGDMPTQTNPARPKQDDDRPRRSKRLQQQQVTMEERRVSPSTQRRRLTRIHDGLAGAAFVALHEILQEPLNMSEARMSPQWPDWQAAIIRELTALRQNKTFDLVERPIGATVLDNTVQFRIKVDANDHVKFKARVCARGDRQVQGVNFSETYAPVASIDTIRVVFVLAIKYKMYLRQGDVPSAYVKAPLDEEIYMSQVRGFEEPGKEQHVWRLRKALYGLRQAGRQWNIEINAFLCDYGLTATSGDHCIYFKRYTDGIMIVCLYVDDILIGHPSEERVLRLMTALNVKYQVKDLGYPKQFLGVRIRKCGEGELRLSQASYTEEVLHRFAMETANPIETPMTPNTRLDINDDGPTEAEVKFMARVPYRQAVGALQYLARVTRPDIAFTVNQLAKHMAKPRKVAWEVAKDLFRYLRGTSSSELVLNPKDDEEGICVTTDASHAQDKVSRRSITGCVIFLFGAPVQWFCNQQSIIAESTTVAEFIAANAGVEEACMLQIVIEEILGTKIPLLLKMDCIPAIRRIQRQGWSATQKTVDVKMKRVRERYQAGEIQIAHLPTDQMPADLLTKALPSAMLCPKRALCELDCTG